MKRLNFFHIVLVATFSMILAGCSMFGQTDEGGGSKRGSKAEKFTKLDDILSDRDVIKDLIEAYDLEEDDGVYTGSDPEVSIEVDGDGRLKRLDILSDGLSFNKVEVGDVYNIDDLDVKMDDFIAATELSTEKGAVYYSDGLRDDYYVYFQSKNSDEIERIIIGLATNKEIEKLTAKVGLTKEGEAETVAAETTPAQTAVAETVPATQPVTVYQYVPAPTQPPQTVYVQVPVYNNQGNDSSYLIPDSSSRYLTNHEINSMSIDFARYTLNEVYARHGRMFNDQNLQQYFNSKSWYRGTVAPSNFKESWLNSVERQNVDKLNKRRNGQYLP